MASEPSYILTAELDAASFAWLDGLRRRHFPPQRNLLAAHLTMFHQLSPQHVARLRALALPQAPLAVSFAGIAFLGFGNAVRVVSAELERVRQTARDAIGEGLSRQDAQRWSPHVTIQNKADPETAKALHRELDGGFVPRDGQATGLLLWHYLGGPWELARRLPFGGA